VRGADPRSAHNRPAARRAILSFGQYAEGAAGLAVVVVALGFAAVRLRARLLPSFSGPTARLAEAVLGLSLLTVSLQLLGTVALLDFAPIVGLSVAIGLGTEWASRRASWKAAVGTPAAGPGGDGIEVGPHPADHRGPEAGVPAAAHRLMPYAAIGIAILVAAHWATAVQASWANGMSGFDTMWYHAPFAARFAQQGSINALHFTDPEYLHWFYPQNSELLHSAGIVLFKHDLLSPFLNLGWLGLGFLAAWCIGRPFGVAPLSLLAVAMVLDTNTMVPREPGNAANDIMVVALLLSAAAILLNAERGTASAGPLSAGALIVAGLAAGLAMGTKLTMAAAAAALTVGVIFLAKGARGRTALIWFASMIVTGGFWFVRNMFHASGDPFPWLAHDYSFLAGPARGLEGRDPFSVAHYLFPPDGGVFGTYFTPDLHGVFGPLWPLLLAVAAAGMVLALARGRAPIIRMLGAAAIAAVVGYVFTPLTASGPPGHPDGFGINLRYLVPPLALGLALLPLDRALADRRRQLVVFAVLAVVTVSVALYSDAKLAWQADAAFAPTAILIGLIVVAVPLGIAAYGRERPRLAAGAAAGLALLIFAIGWTQQDNYLGGRYTTGFRFHLVSAFRWANGVSDARIGVGGTSGAFQQYGLYGRGGSNYVQYVGRPGENGDFSAIDNCPEWRRAVNAGHYDYLVTTPKLDLNHAGSALPSPEGGWARTDPAATPILRDGQVEVFTVLGALHPARCPVPR